MTGKCWASRTDQLHETGSPYYRSCMKPDRISTERVRRLRQRRRVKGIIPVQVYAPADRADEVRALAKRLMDEAVTRGVVNPDQLRLFDDAAPAPEPDPTDSAVPPGTRRARTAGGGRAPKRGTEESPGPTAKPVDAPGARRKAAKAAKQAKGGKGARKRT